MLVPLKRCLKKKLNKIKKPKEKKEMKGMKEMKEEGEGAAPLALAYQPWAEWGLGDQTAGAAESSGSCSRPWSRARLGNKAVASWSCSP